MARNDDPYDYNSNRHGFWRFLCIAIVAICGLVVYAMFAFDGLKNPAAMEQACVARNLAAGKGFTSHVIRPLDLTLQDMSIEDIDGPIRSTWHAPFYPRCLSWVFKIVNAQYVFSRNGKFDAEVKAIIPFSIMLVLLTTLLIWFLAKELLDDQAANLSALVFLVSPTSLMLVVDGGAYPLGMLLSVLLLFLAWQSSKANIREKYWWLTLLYASLAGMVGGMLLLTSFASIFFVVGIGVFLFLQLQKLRPLVISCFCLFFVCVALFWFLGNGTSTGWAGTTYPYAALFDTSIFPGDMLLRDMGALLRGWEVRAAVREGIANRYAAMLQGNLLGSGGIIIVFFLVSLFQHEERHWNQYLKWIVAGVLFLHPILPATIDSPYHHWILLMPVLVIFGVRAFVHLVDREEFFDASIKPILTGLLVLLCFLPTGAKMLRRQSGVYPPFHGPLQSYVGEWVHDGQLVATDLPAATSWYGQSLSLLLPISTDGVDSQKVTAIYLTSEMPVDASSSDWVRMRLDAVLPHDLDYPNAMYLPTGTRDQVLFLRSASNHDRQ